MGRKPEKGSRKQGNGPFGGDSLLGQLLLPMVGGLAATKQALFGLVQQVGIEAIERYFRDEAEAMVGPKGGWQPGRVTSPPKFPPSWTLIFPPAGR